MIPSTPRRTVLFLGLCFLLYYAPDLLTPEPWQHAASYPLLSAVYQGILVLLGFGYGPAICRAMVVHEIDTGPQRFEIDQAVAMLSSAGCRLPPVVLFEHAAPFMLTVGLLPRQCQLFVSTALAQRLSASGLHFLLARAAVHAAWHQRLAALLPVLAFTVLLPDPKNLADWLAVIGFLALWLLLHWIFELDADRQAARIMGKNASQGLREFMAASASPLGWLTPHPPLHWRLRAVSAGGKSNE